MDSDAMQNGFSPKDGNEPAMPVQGIRESDDSLKLYGQLFHGLTKREHFAAMAMQSMLNNAGRNGYEFHEMDKVAIDAVEMSNALLSALEDKS